jgi:hypothetical protein
MCGLTGLLEITIISAFKKEASLLSKWWSTESSAVTVKMSSTEGCFDAASIAKLVRGKVGYGVDLATNRFLPRTNLA